MIYLASPYCLGGSLEVHSPEARARVRSVALVAAMLTNKNLRVYSPVIHAHFMGSAKGDLFWRRHGLDMLRRCDRLVVCDNMDNWETSIGVQAEIETWERLEELEGRKRWERLTDLFKGMGAEV